MEQTRPTFTVKERSLARLLLGTGLLCFAASAATIHFTSDGRSLAMIWPANAIVLALMLVRPSRDWPHILGTAFVSILAANMVTRQNLVGEVGLSAMNCVEVLVAATLVAPWLDRGSAFRASRAAWAFVLICGIAAPAVSALGGALFARACYGQDYAGSCLTWLLSHSLGLLLFTPVFSSIARADYQKAMRAADRMMGVRTAMLLLFTALIAYLVFGVSNLPVLFLPVVPVMLATFRIGRIGTELSVLIVAIIGAAFTLTGHGPVAALVPGVQHQVHFLQFYLATLLLTSIPVSAELNARRVLTAKLARSEQAVKLLAANSAGALLAFDTNGICRNAAGAAERLLAKRPDQLIGEPAEALATQEGAPDLAIAIKAALEDPGMTAICEFRSAATPYLWLEASVTSDGETGLVATIRDVTERKEREAALTLLARTDGLTGALNRAGFLETLDEFVTRDPDRPYALAAIDIDHFKQINDRFGHHGGDAALQQLARLLASGVRRGDAVGRIGGDEFMIALRATDLETAAAICSRLTETVHGTIFTLPGGGSMRISISCGLAQHQLGEPSEVTRQTADQALYEAKRAGRNRISVAA